MPVLPERDPEQRDGAHHLEEDAELPALLVPHGLPREVVQARSADAPWSDAHDGQARWSSSRTAEANNANGERKMIKKTSKVWNKDVLRGIEIAAGGAEVYDRSSTHRLMLEDCILAKLNVLRGKPRVNKHRVQDPKDAWICGFVTALAEMRRFGHDDTGVCEAARNAGITIKSAKAAGVMPFDWKELKEAGVL